MVIMYMFLNTGLMLNDLTNNSSHRAHLGGWSPGVYLTLARDIDGNPYDIVTNKSGAWEHYDLSTEELLKESWEVWGKESPSESWKEVAGPASPRG